MPAVVQWVGVGLLVAAVALSGLWALTEHWRRATFTLGCGLIWLAALRLTCDSQILGVVAVRSVRFDVAYTAILGGLMVFFAASVDALGS